MIEQKIITAENGYKTIEEWIKKNNIQRIFLVCGNSINLLTKISTYFEELSAISDIIKFDEFRPNPLYESVVKGVDVFRKNSCDGIIAVGGGSAIDVAKCIKLYSNIEGDGACGDYLKQSIIPSNIPFLVIPTTAGTGSESTEYAVLYYKGVKQSIANKFLVPDTVFLDSSVLETLSIYQKKSTMMDAFSHAIESFWSVNSTCESKKYSKTALQLIMENMEGYLKNTKEGNQNMLMAANIAGKAINITQTTAGHAMCYKITSLFDITHGHAAILCNRVLFSWMIKNINKCIDPRGEKYLIKTFQEISYAIGCKTVEGASSKVEEIFNKLEFKIPVATETQFEELTMSVNPIRLRNHPIKLSEKTISKLYHKILN